MIIKNTAPGGDQGAAENGRSTGSHGSPDLTDWEHGLPLRPIAEHFESLGWQMVPTQWHRQADGSYGQTPISGVTGKVAFLTAEQACREGLVLHRTGGPECTGQFAKPALRPPTYVTGFDVDHYGDKTGGDTIAALEKLLGPLPPTYSLTARGPYQPSRRLWFQHPRDLVIPDRIFTPHGGCVETIRTGHRFSWTEPAIHVRQGQIVDPVQWYGPDHRATSMPHVEVLAVLPDAWVEYVRAHGSAGANNASAGAHNGSAGVHNAEPGEVTPKTRDAVDGGIAKMIKRLHGMPPAGGQFRNDVFGLAAELTRREIARGNTTDTVMAQMRQLFADHPKRLTMDAHDERWAREGIEKGEDTPYRFVAAECIDLFGNYRPAAPNGAVSEQGPTSTAGGQSPPNPTRDGEESTFIGGATFLRSAGTDEPPLWGDRDTCLWAPGEPVMLVGPPGVGKSTLAHLLIWGVLGFISDVLGYPIRSDGRRVAYLAMDRPRQIARAMGRLAVPVSDAVLEDRLRVHKGPLPVSFVQNPGWILNQAFGLNAGTVVVDSLKDLLASPSDEETASLYNRARQQCLAAGIEWIELHHNRKANGNNTEPKTLDDVYGNRMITAGAGSVLSLYGQPGDTVVRLSQIKTPSGELFPKWVSIDKETGAMALHENVTLDVVITTAGPGGISAREAAVRVYGVTTPSRSNIQALRNKLDRMVRDGVAERVEVGPPGGDSDVRYRKVAP